MNKTKYDPKITPTIILWMSRSGLSNEEMAKELTVSRKTLDTWKKKHLAVEQALRAGKNWFDASAEQKLFQTVMGYKTTEVSVNYKYCYDRKTKEPIIDPLTGKTKKIPMGESHTTKEIPPNITSLIFWLKNRQPDKWNDVQKLDLKGKLETEHKTVHVNYDSLTEEEAKELFKDAMLKDE